MKQLRQLLARPLLCVAGLSFVVNVLLLVPAIFMLQVFDRVLVSQSSDTLTMLLLGVGLSLMLLLALDHLRARLQGVSGHLAAELLAPTVARLAIAQGARKQGARSEGLSDVGALRAVFSSQGLLAVFDAPWILVYVAFIWLAHPLLGMAAAAAAVLMLALALVTDRWTRKNIHALTRAATQAHRFLDQSLAHAEVAHAMGMSKALLARWRQHNADALALQGPTASKTVLMAAMTRTLRQMIQVVMLALGAWLVIRGEASSGVMIATSTLLGRALAPVEQVVSSWRVLAEGRAAYGRLATLLGAEAELPPKMALPAPSGALLAQNLIYRAPQGERVILAGVSLQLDAGQSLAVIGPSGAGKSTLVRLLLGIWAPSAGSVRLDGADLAQWPRDEVGPYLGYVPQDVELFAATVAENIARLADVDADAVVRAAQRAHVHDMILALPQGYDTPIDPASAVLSPGQRQRIALARALYGDPKLLVLDEPNANLDGAGEQALAAALRDLRGQVTVVVVTHRQPLVQDVDKVLVLEAGVTKHYGSTADVMKAMRGVPARGPVANLLESIQRQGTRDNMEAKT